MDLNSRADAVSFYVDLSLGDVDLEANIIIEDGETMGAYFVYVTKL